MTGGLVGEQTGVVERLSGGDLTVLVTDRGPAPMQIAALLTLAPGARPSLAELSYVLAERIPRVPRLRQRLVSQRRGTVRCRGRSLGRPFWEDDPGFDLAQHLTLRTATNQDELLAVAAELVCERLDDRRPLWRACLVSGTGGTPSALVLVMHHVLTDGLGGLAVLGALADAPPGTFAESPAPVPAAPLRGRPSSHSIRTTLSGLRELGLGRRPRLAARTSLNRPTGQVRRLAVTGAPLGQVRAAAHRAGGTVNDVVVAAVVGALQEVLRHRGERPEALVVSVPVSARRGTDARSLGNEVGVRPIRVPTLEDHHERLRSVVALRRAAGAAPRASSAAPLGLAFRGLARAGLFQWFIDRQRLVHTFVTNMHGPDQLLSVAGHEITALAAVAVTPGNVAVSFDVLSYAGWLGITTVADPEHVPDLELLERSLGAALHALTG